MDIVVGEVRVDRCFLRWLGEVSVHGWLWW